MAALAVCLASAVVPGAAADGQPARPAAQVTAADPGDESQDFRFPGADTIVLHDGSNKYVTYGASSRGRKVPYSVHGSGSHVGTSPIIAGDAMPNGGGAWVDNTRGIWTPGAFYHTKNGVGRYYLFYTAAKKGTEDKHCVGVASSTNPFSGFRAEATPIACPTKATRWAIDADVARGPEGAIWLTWRDGQRAEGPESALSVMMLSFKADGTVDRATKPRVLLRSDNLAWAKYRDAGGVTVIENPSLFHRNNAWYLFYSGNSWPTNYYSTGIAFCGARIDDGLCSPMPGPRRAWFSYSGPRAHLPSDMRRRGLPGNKRGPGAMDVYRARDGRPWVTWNYLSDQGGRKSRTGRLVVSGSGANADFQVRLP
ncbi:MAG TPA: family 43 glycosylhydrolase [Actinophytocola sp.]|nr:family 43 glycosylhydrolase [Actinophytocola sp.]